MTIPLQDRIVYGPLVSRRLGRSLGVNLLPTRFKICNLNCAYCQYENSGPPAEKFPTAGQIGLACDEAMKHAAGDRMDSITLSGNGEPTLHPHFEEAVARVLESRDRHLPGVPVNILSNSTTCHRPAVARALARLDGRYMKLDAGSAPAFDRVNGPAASGAWHDVVGGLRALKKIVLQSMFFDGPAGNVSERDVDDWVRLVAFILPERVQIYTIDRTPRDASSTPAPKRTLESIAGKLEKAGIWSRVY